MKYQSHSETSRSAAEESQSTAATLRAEVASFLKGRGSTGATDEEIQIATMIKPNTQRPRRVELVEGGVVFDSGFVRKTNSNRDAVVWVHQDHITDDMLQNAFERNDLTMEARLSLLGFQTYNDYLNSQHWADFKADYYARNPKRCFVSGETSGIHLHHLHYHSLGRETDEDVVPLAEACHDAVHFFVSEHKVPLKEAHLLVRDAFELFS